MHHRLTSDGWRRSVLELSHSHPREAYSYNAPMDSSEFQIKLHAFTGPFDLLHHLVKKNEIDLREVSLAGIAQQFLEYLQVLEWLDFELAGDFLVVAATLMELKSRLLLAGEAEPQQQPVEESPSSLVRQLLEYRRYKKAAGFLEQLSDRQEKQFAREPDGESSAASASSIRKAEIWDLLNLFGKLVREAAERGNTQTIVDETPQIHYEEAILELLREKSPRQFEEIFIPPRTKIRLIGFFLALLELVKQQRVSIYFGDGESIYVAANLI